MIIINRVRGSKSNHKQSVLNNKAYTTSEACVWTYELLLLLLLLLLRSIDCHQSVISIARSENRTLAESRSSEVRHVLPVLTSEGLTRGKGSCVVVVVVVIRTAAIFAREDHDDTFVEIRCETILLPQKRKNDDASIKINDNNRPWT